MRPNLTSQCSSDLGQAGILAELWTVVFAVALISWGLAEAIARLVGRGSR
jgi:hypothetical protein